MRHFGMRHFAGLALPAVGDVRSGVTYGPNSSLTGTLNVSGGGGSAPDLTDGNLNQLETTEVYALESYYASTGIDAQYYSKANDASTWITVILLSRNESLVYENDVQQERETIVLLLKRFGTNSISRPAALDRVSIPSLDGTRKYTLTQTPVVSSGQLEWKAEFSRSKQVKGGGKSVVGVV
jgi:hypothetical protein